MAIETADFQLGEWNQWKRATYNKIPTVSLQLNPRVKIEKRNEQWQVWVNGYQMKTINGRIWSHYVERMIETFAKLSQAKQYVVANPAAIKSEIEMLEAA